MTLSYGATRKYSTVDVELGPDSAFEGTYLYKAGKLD